MKVFSVKPSLLKICCAYLALMLGCIDADAQGLPTDGRFPGDRPSSLVTTGIFYQKYVLDEDRHIEEISFPVYLAVPIGRSTGISLRASPATVNGRDLAPISGLSDAQVQLSHAATLRGSSFVFNLGLNLPSGRRALTQEELATTVQLSRNFFDFRTPAFGQGFNISPGVTWAFPAGDMLVLGIGVAYQYKGSFKPLEGMDESYQPGSEILITGGADVRIAPGAALSGDVTYTRYGTDKIGSEDVFESGDRVVATVQLLRYQGFDALRVVGRFRTRGKGSLPAPGADAVPALQTLANQLDLFTSYRMETTSATSIGLHAGVHYFDESDVFSSKLLFSAGVTPEMRLANAVDFWTRFSVRLGDFTGLEAGTGLSFGL
jgi:hypothetical protein